MPSKDAFLTNRRRLLMKRITDTPGLIHIYTHPVQFVRYTFIHTLLGRYDATNGQHAKWCLLLCILYYWHSESSVCSLNPKAPGR